MLGTLHRLFTKRVEPLLAEDWVIWVRGVELALLTVVALLAYRFLVGWLERRPARELGRLDAVREFGIGFGFSGAMIVTCVLLIMLFGSYQVTALLESTPQDSTPTRRITWRNSTW